jgi:nitronate monooxygenase
MSGCTGHTVDVIRTRFTDLFELDHPIMSAPMAGGSTGGDIAAAVTEAGGLGTFGAMRIDIPAAPWAVEQIGAIRARTSRAFGVGFITPFMSFGPDLFDAVIEQRPPAIVFSFSDPQPWLGRAKDAGCKTICQVQTLDLARMAVDAGADVLAAQGNEAGGHTGVMGLLPFLATVVEAFPDVPVLAAGGIGSGRTLAAVLAAGADGGWIGTAFLATHEATAPWKDTIVSSDGGDTVFTHAYDIASGLPWPEPIGERVRRDAFTEKWAGRDEELKAAPEAPGTLPVLYGPAAAFVDRIRPAAEVVSSISADAERILRERTSEIVR